MLRDDIWEGLVLIMNDGEVNSLALSAEKARMQLGLGRSLMYEAIRSKQIPSIRIGRRILIPRVALERLLEGAKDGDNKSEVTYEIA